MRYAVERLTDKGSHGTRPSSFRTTEHIHPQLKQDLLPAEWQEVVDLMAKATDIVGERFSKALAQVDPTPPGNA